MDHCREANKKKLHGKMKTENRVVCFKDVPLNTTSIPQALLNIEKKERSNPFPWNGQFSPQFVQALLQKYSTRDSLIFDPFAGSGTVLYEAGRENLQAIGSELNPAAYIMARTYRFINVEHQKRKPYIEEIDDVLERVVRCNLPLFVNGPISVDISEEIKCELLNTHKELQNSMSKHLFETLIVRLDFYRPNLDGHKIFKIWNDLKKFIMELPYSNKPVDILNCDARRLPLRSNLIDLVITSPPYINVLNYHQQYRDSIEALGWNILAVAKSEIGSNRKNRGNRFLTVIQYCLDIAQALSEIKRVCQHTSRIIFVVGKESRIRSTRFLNGQIVAALGVYCAGLNLETRQERVFRNKFGEMIYEDILHFIPSTKKDKDLLKEARNVAKEVLKDAIKRAPKESKNDISSALECLNGVQPSAFYEQMRQVG